MSCLPFSPCAVPHTLHRAYVFGALILLLQQPHPHTIAPAAVAADGSESRWSDLVVKCMIKVTKTLPASMEVGNKCWDHVCKSGICKTTNNNK